MSDFSDSMAGLPVSIRSQWWRRSPNTCCSKKILLLLVWLLLFTFSLYMLLHVLIHDTYILYSSVVVSYSSGPLIGYLADVKFGRYKIIKFGSIVSFLTSILYLFSIFIGGTIGTVLSSLAIIIMFWFCVFYSSHASLHNRLGNRCHF